MAAKKKAVEAALTKLIGLVRKKSANIRAIEKGDKKLPGSKSERDRELKRLKDDLADAKEKVRKQKAKVEGAKDPGPKALDEGPTKKSLKRKRRQVRDEPKDRKGPKAKKRIEEEAKLDKRLDEKRDRRAKRERGKEDDVGMTERLEIRLQEEKDLRRFGNKGRDFEAKVDSEQAGRGAFRKKLDFDRQDLAKQQRNYARQNARANDEGLPAAERRAAREEMRKLRAQFGDAVVETSIKLAKRPAPKRRTPIGDKAPKAPKPKSLRQAFNQAQAAGDKNFTFGDKRFSVAALDKKFKAAEAKLGLQKGGDVKKKKIPVVTVGIGMIAAPKGKKPRTGNKDFRNGGMVMSSTNNLKPVPSGNKGKGLSMLPKSVRNNMGFMRKGGMVKK